VYKQRDLKKNKRQNKIKSKNHLPFVKMGLSFLDDKNQYKPTPLTRDIADLI